MLHTVVAAAALALTGPRIGSPAPDFHLRTVAGKPVALADFRGKTLVVNDWATWCPPCREETPDLIASARRLSGAGDVVFLGVDSTEQAPIVRAFVAAKGVPYAQAIDDGSFEKAYDVRAFPSTFVIGPDGVLRARFIGLIDRTTLAGLVADARAGRDGVVASAAQRKADALLDPKRFRFTGDLATLRVQARRALSAIDAAENVDGPADYLRIQAEENVLRDAAAGALAPLAVAPADRALVARLRGDADAARERWSDAAAQYRAGLALTPNDPDLVAGLAQAYGGQRDRARAARWYARLAELHPSVDASIDLGNVLAKSGRYAEGRRAFARAIALGEASVAAKPRDAKARRVLAAAYLYEGRLETRAGDAARARAAFARAAATAQRLPKTDSRYAMDLEEAQEGIVALDVARPARGTALSLAPWTGPDLPGSIASTYKYRLIVAGTPGASVTLGASGLPARWVASFCADGQCAPFRTTIALPDSGVKVVEFQLVPMTPLRGSATVHVRGGGADAAVAVGARA